MPRCTYCYLLAKQMDKNIFSQEITKKPLLKKVEALTLIIFFYFKNTSIV